MAGLSTSPGPLCVVAKKKNCKWDKKKKNVHEKRLRIINTSDRNCALCIILFCLRGVWKRKNKKIIKTSDRRRNTHNDNNIIIIIRDDARVSRPSEEEFGERPDRCRVGNAIRTRAREVIRIRAAVRLGVVWLKKLKIRTRTFDTGGKSKPPTWKR